MAKGNESMSTVHWRLLINGFLPLILSGVPYALQWILKKVAPRWLVGPAEIEGNPTYFTIRQGRPYIVNSVTKVLSAMFLLSSGVGLNTEVWQWDAWPVWGIVLIGAAITLVVETLVMSVLIYTRWYVKFDGNTVTVHNRWNKEKLYDWTDIKKAELVETNMSVDGWAVDVYGNKKKVLFNATPYMQGTHFLVRRLIDGDLLDSSEFNNDALARMGIFEKEMK